MRVLRTTSLRVAALLPLVALAACSGGSLEPHGPIASAERTLMLDSMIIMLAIIGPTIIATLAFGWWYRASNGKARFRPEFVHSGKIELLTWSAPLLTIMLLGGVTWVSSHELDPAKPLVSKNPTLDVEVVSLDWKWLFIYPKQHVASINRLVIPADTPIHFSMTSASVMNTFFVPQLGSSLYTMSGMATSLYLQADKPGTYPGLSGHYSGDGFSDMHFDVVAQTPDQFDASIAAIRAKGPTLDSRSYDDLLWQSTPPNPFTYRDVEPDLFHKIVSLALPSGYGPTKGQPGAPMQGAATPAPTKM